MPCRTACTYRVSPLYVFLHVSSDSLVAKCLVALLALIGLFGCMCSCIYLQISLVAKCLFTLIALIAGSHVTS